MTGASTARQGKQNQPDLSSSSGGVRGDFAAALNGQRTRPQGSTHTQTSLWPPEDIKNDNLKQHTYIYIHINICIKTYVCVFIHTQSMYIHTHGVINPGCYKGSNAVTGNKEGGQPLQS